MSAFHILLHLLPKILLYDRNFSERHLGIRIVLDLLEHTRQHSQRIILRVRHQKR